MSALPLFRLNMRMRVQPIPFRLRVLKSVTHVIEGVTPNNGYHHDLRGKVFRGRVRYDRDDPIPMISILEAPIPEDAAQGTGENVASYGNWELLIQGFVDDDRVNPSDPAHHLMAEVKSVIVKEKLRSYGDDLFGMDNRVRSMSIGQGSVRPSDDPTAEAFFWFKLTLNVVEDLESPYD